MTRVGIIVLPFQFDISSAPKERPSQTCPLIPVVSPFSCNKPMIVLGHTSYMDCPPRVCSVEITHEIWGTPTPILRQHPGINRGLVFRWTVYISSPSLSLLLNSTERHLQSKCSSSMRAFHILSHLHPTLPLPIEVLVYFALHYPGSKEHSLPYIHPNMPQAHSLNFNYHEHPMITHYPYT